MASTCRHFLRAMDNRLESIFHIPVFGEKRQTMQAVLQERVPISPLNRTARRFPIRQIIISTRLLPSISGGVVLTSAGFLTHKPRPSPGFRVSASSARNDGVGWPTLRPSPICVIASSTFYLKPSNESKGFLNAQESGCLSDVYGKPETWIRWRGTIKTG